MNSTNRIRRTLAVASPVVAVAIIAGLLLTDRSNPVPPTDDDAIALVPGDTSPWGTARTFTDSWPHIPSGEVVFVAPTGGRNRMARSAMINVVSTPVAVSLSRAAPSGDEVAGAGLVGRLERFGRDARQELHVAVDYDGSGHRRIVVSAGPDATVDTLFELAAHVDPSRPLADQPPLEGWEVIGSVTNTYRPTRTYQGFEGEYYAGAYLDVTTLTGASEQDIWLFAPPFLGDAQRVRGKMARAVRDGSTVQLIWAERDDMVVRLDYYNPDHDGRALLSLALGEAENLTGVNEQGWDQIPRPSPSSP